mgnify:FL=1
METFRAFTYMDIYGRLVVTASTQVTFHVRRILAHALDVPKSKIRVIKPRIGGGFGAKQTVIAEVYPAIVTMKTGKPAKIVYSRYESQIASSPRHEMEVKVKLGCDDEGIFTRQSTFTPCPTQRLRRARADDRRTFRTQIYSSVRNSKGLPLCL